MLVVQEVFSANHLLVRFEFNKHVAAMYKTHCSVRSSILTFNSSLSPHFLFDAYMQQILGAFSDHINSHDLTWHNKFLAPLLPSHEEEYK